MTFLACLAARQPTQPVITATAISASSISIALTMASTVSVGSIAFYSLSRSINGAPAVAIQDVSPAAFPFLDTGLPTATTVSYFAEAVNNSANKDASQPSNTSSATTQAGTGPTPSQPQILATATSSSAISIALMIASTEPINGIKNYQLQRSVSSSAFSTIATLLPSAWPYADTGLTAITAYSYRAFSVDNDAALTPSQVSAVTTATTKSASTAFSISVSGKTLINQNGQVVQLRGCAIDGMQQYAQGLAAWGSGPDPWTVAGMGTTQGSNGVPGTIPDVSWLISQKINAIRVPGNQSSALGGTLPRFPGDGTHNADPLNNYLATLVKSCVAWGNLGLYVIVNLHWSAPDGYLSTQQQSDADSVNGPAYWTKLANALKSYPHVMFELYNEPHDMSDSQMRNGGYSVGIINTHDNGQPGVATWSTSGYQALITAVRNTGATNVCLLGGQGYSADFTWWVNNPPTDTLSPPQLAISKHDYGGYAYSFNTDYANCVNALNAPGVPVVITETGGAYIVGVINAHPAQLAQYGVMAWQYSNNTSYPYLVNPGGWNVANPSLTADGTAYFNWTKNHT